MNRNELKAAVDEFVDELVSYELSRISEYDGSKVYALRIADGTVHDGAHASNVEAREKALKARVAKVYRKHIKRVMEKKAAAEGSKAPVS